MLAFDNVAWDCDDPSIKRIMNFLHALSDVNRPVAFIRWGQDFEAWSNKIGYTIFQNRVSYDEYKSAIVFAEDDDDIE